MKGKTTIVLTIIFIVLLFNPLSAQDAKETLPSVKNKNILIVYGGWEGHQPDVFAQRVKNWLLKEGAKVSLSDSLGIYTDSLFMEKVDLIIQYWTMGTISNEQSKALLKAVKHGTGIAGCHGGLGDSFRQNTDYQYMIGGQWVSHPGGKINYKVDITNSLDPITLGLNDFEILDTEQYFMHVDPNNKVLATTTFSADYDPWIKGMVMPVVWKKYYDRGRVFYLSLGHDPKDFDTPAAWELLTRGIRWASGSKYLPKEQITEPAYPSNSK